MKKIISILLVITILATFPVDIFALSVTSNTDVSAEELEEVLSGTNLAQYSEAFADAAKTDGINPYFLVAIAALESGWGRSELAVQHGNLFGMKRNGQYMRWDDKSGNHAEYSIYYEAYILRYRYIDRGADTVEAIGQIYCDEEWTELVEGIWKKLEGTV